MRRFAVLMLAAALAACAQDGDAGRPVATEIAMPAPVRTRTEANRDDALKALVERRLSEADHRAFRAVHVEIWQGRALLMGAVVKPDHRRKAEQMARSVEGIAETLNELVLAEDRALEMFAADPAREAAIRQALGIEGKAGTSVRIVNGVAFLLGAASSPSQAARMKADALDVDGVKWVVSHLKVE